MHSDHSFHLLQVVRGSRLPLGEDESDYRNNPKYWDRQAWANGRDPDYTLQNTASDQGLNSLSLILLFLDIYRLSNGVVQILGEIK